ncbi:hypothetical protein [Yinghuangia seranimata]|uniref:hypothetical protein n=1 Tax=Yinghuangia seranimata TaxID=408067 RepID=UPI00248BDFC1|nr:hypothetical protein [Yinghuangia seranimata]MDI2131274.1 hypothetical protein [Yinghuangia seranimata]
MHLKRVKAAAVAALSATGLFLASASPASAGGYNWDDQIGPDGKGCYAWTTWSQYMVQPHMWQQPGNVSVACLMRVEHVGYDATWSRRLYYNSWPDSGEASTTGRSTGFDGPNWYYGPWDGSGHMCVVIKVRTPNMSVPDTAQYC